MKETTVKRATRDKDNPYRMISRAAMEDDKLTFEARGALAYILVKPDNWEIQINDLRRAGNMGRDRTYRIINELISFGYITRTIERGKGGLIKRTVYMVYENPQVPEESTPEQPVNSGPLPEKPDTAEPDTAEPLPVNTDRNNKEESSIEDSFTKEEGGENPVGSTGPSDPSPTPQPAPAPTADALIAAAEKVAEAETFDGPKPAVNGTTKHRQQPQRVTSELYDPRKLVDGYIPAGEGTTAVEVYFERYSPSTYKLTKPQQDDLKRVITDLELWRQAVTEWNQTGSNPQNIRGMLDWYRDPSRLPSNRFKQPGSPLGTYTNGASKPASVNPDIKLKDWLLRTYNGNHLPTVIALTGKAEQELRNEFKQWRIANGLPPG